MAVDRMQTQRFCLELKFTNRFPLWFGELVRTFNIMQRGAAKYCESIQAVGAEVLGAKTHIAQDEENWLEPV